MITIAQDSKRSIRITQGNLDNDHISITKLRGFLPADCFGPSKGKDGNGRTISIELDGLDKAVETDVACDAKSGKPRRQFRGRGWVRQFYRHHGIRSGDILEFERLGERSYFLRVAKRIGKSSGAPYRLAEFFAGIGLVRLALEKHGFETVFANDIAQDKLDMYAANFSTLGFHLGDIHQLAAGIVPDCDVITASFPCTDLSIAGEMKGIYSGESSAFWGLIRILREMQGRRPPIVVLENVPGFMMSHQGRDFESALQALNELGYAVDAFFVDAASFVPQSRLRLFVIGKLDVPGFIPFGLENSRTRPSGLTAFMSSHPEIRWDIRKLPLLPERNKSLASVIEDLPDDDPAWWNADRSSYFMNQLSDRHETVAKKMIAGRRFTYATAFRRVRNGRSMAELRNDGLAGCLRTPKGGSGRQILFKAGKGRRQVRLLTARECARLQGVGDSYVIKVPLNQALMGFGDAVCVPVIEWIADNYLLPQLAELEKISTFK